MIFPRKDKPFGTRRNYPRILFNKDKHKIDTKEINVMVIPNIYGGQTGKK